MSKIEVAPRIRCDNCGAEQEQVLRTGWQAPDGWQQDIFGHDDLCKRCVGAADDAAEAALAGIAKAGPRLTA